MNNRLRSTADMQAFAQRLADQARLLGDETTHSAIANVLESAATGSEQLGMLRSALLLCRSSVDERYPEDMRQVLDEAIEELDAAFRRANWIV